MTKDSKLHLLEDLPPSLDHLTSLQNIDIFTLNNGQSNIMQNLMREESQSGLKIKTEVDSVGSAVNQEQGNQRK